MLLMCLATAFSVTTGGRDRGVRAALGHQPEHLALARREPVERLVAAARAITVATTSGSRTVPPASDPSYAVDELRDVGDPVLEQVADRPLAAGQQLAGVELLDVLRQHHDREPRPRGADAIAARRPSSV